MQYYDTESFLLLRYVNIHIFANYSVIKITTKLKFKNGTKFKCSKILENTHT